MSLVKLTYYLDHDDPAPEPQRYLVSIGKKGVGSVYFIAAVHKVEHRGAVEQQCYVLGVTRQPHLKALTEYDQQTDSVWVQGEPAYPLFWFPR